MEVDDAEEIQIEELVDIHRQIIAEKLQPLKILHYLMFLTEQQKEEIRKKEQSKTSCDACKILLRCVAQSMKKGKYKSFKNAIKKAEFTHLESLLDGFPTTVNDKAYTKFMNFISLEKNWLQIVDPKTVVPHLFAQEVIDQTDGEEIIKASNNESNFFGNSILSNYVRRKVENWLPKTIWAFTKAGHCCIFQDALPTLDDIEKASVNDIDKALNKWIDKMYTKDEDERGSEPSSTEQYEMEYLEDVSEKLLEGANAYNENTSAKDLDDITHKRKTLVLRPYQSELENYAKQGENCLIQAPTGSGKTHVAMAITKHHLTERGITNKRRKVAFLVPYTYLVRQQCNMYREYLDFKTDGLRGAYNPGDRVDMRTSMENHDILVMTPQLLVEAIQRKDVKLSEFTLLIFDECHHVTGKHPFNLLMKIYMKLKWHERVSKSELPQVIGLTASVGVGKGGGLDKAKDHILKLCANLDSRIVEVTVQQDNLKTFSNNPTDEIFEVDGRLFDPFFDQICDLMEWIEDNMKYSTEAQSVVEDKIFDDFMDMLKSKGKPGSLQYKQWVSTLEQKISNIPDERRGVFVVCLFHLLVYTNAIEVHMDCRSEDAIDYIEKMFNSNMDYREKIKEWDVTYIDRRLLKQYTEKKPVLRQLGAAHPNPKLQALKKLILRYLRKSPKARGIIVCKTLNLSLALLHWASNDSDIKSLAKVKRLVGARRSEDKGGITPEQQDEVLKDFRSGKTKLLIATYFEGMDIPDCTFDIIYEHATNEITRIQAKGRGRAEGAVHANIGDPTLGNIEKELESQQREKLMYQAVSSVCSMSPNGFISEIEDLQQRALLEDSIALNRSKSTGNSMGYTIKCKKCDHFVCKASDMRCLDENHHIVLDAAFYDIDRVTLKQHKKPGMMGTELEKIDKLICPRRTCGQDWGINAIYKYTKIPILKKGSALVFYNKLGRSEALAEWSTLPFRIEDLEDGEFLQYQKEINKPQISATGSSREIENEVMTTIPMKNNETEQILEPDRKHDDKKVVKKQPISPEIEPMDQSDATLCYRRTNLVERDGNNKSASTEVNNAITQKMETDVDVLLEIDQNLEEDFKPVWNCLRKEKDKLVLIIQDAGIQCDQNEPKLLFLEWYKKMKESGIKEVIGWSELLNIMKKHNCKHAVKALTWALEKFQIRSAMPYFQRGLSNYKSLCEKLFSKGVLSKTDGNEIDHFCDAEDVVEYLFQEVLLKRSRINFTDFRDIMRDEQPDLADRLELPESK